jgi:hypothetical protein
MKPYSSLAWQLGFPSVCLPMNQVFTQRQTGLRVWLPIVFPLRSPN